MKILIVGGTGMIGTHLATHLREQGNDVSLAARTPPGPESAVSGLPVLLRDYSQDGFSVADLEEFEAVVLPAVSKATTW